jgi:hypothetical protein
MLETGTQAFSRCAPRSAGKRQCGVDQSTIGQLWMESLAGEKAYVFAKPERGTVRQNH